MRERVNEFAGVLEIAADEGGTRVKAILPLRTKAQKVRSKRNRPQRLADSEFRGCY